MTTIAYMGREEEVLGGILIFRKMGRSTIQEEPFESKKCYNRHNWILLLMSFLSSAPLFNSKSIVDPSIGQWAFGSCGRTVFYYFVAGHLLMQSESSSSSFAIFDRHHCLLPLFPIECSSVATYIRVWRGGSSTRGRIRKEKFLFDFPGKTHSPATQETIHWISEST